MRFEVGGGGSVATVDARRFRTGCWEHTTIAKTNSKKRASIFEGPWAMKKKQEA